jgi:homoserine dehydrogenase
VQRALSKGLGVVTANKMLLAHRGPALLDLAVEKRADLAFEGAVGGGIPIIRTLRDSFAGDRVESLAAIINGTCNYVLTRMREAGVSLDLAIREAQDKGYAEADPSLDVDGHDAAHKLVVLAMLAFGARVDAAQVSTEGIRMIDEVDHRFAARFGYVIKHLAVGHDRAGAVELRVHPAFVPQSSVLANVSGVLNAVHLQGRGLGPCLVYGRGAGDLPTAVSVVSDIIDVARSLVAGVGGLQTRAIHVEPRPLLPMSEVTSRYYLRFPVADRPGVMARLAGALGDAGVSIEQIVQEGEAERHDGGPRPPSPPDLSAPSAALREPRGEGKPVEVVMITHRAREGAIRAAFEAIAGESFVVAPARLLRIVER